jgi:hypothetical protein
MNKIIFLFVMNQNYNWLFKNKKMKEKISYFKQKEYSNRYINLFNNQEFSDFKIKFEKTKNEIHVHKLLICSASTYFENVKKKN